MNEEAAFLSAIRENPADDTARLVYADWLDEQGDPEQTAKAEFIRIELQLASPPEHGLHRVRLQTQIRKAAAELDPGWLMLVTHPRLEACELQFKLACPRQWSGLQPTDEPKKRFCRACRLHVHYCDTIQKAQNHAAQGDCVAVSLGLVRRTNDVRPPRTNGVQPIRNPVAGGLRLTPEMIERLRTASIRGMRLTSEPKGSEQGDDSAPPPTAPRKKRRQNRRQWKREAERKQREESD